MKNVIMAWMIAVAVIPCGLRAQDTDLPSDPAALTAMADRLFADHGAGVDDAQAFKLYQMAADQGHAPAQFRLGYMYAVGRGVPVNEAVAAEWYRKAVAQSYAPAITNLGVMYNEGRGVPRDPKVAMDLLTRAAMAGDKRARDYMIDAGLRR